MSAPAPLLDPAPHPIGAFAAHQQHTTTRGLKLSQKQLSWSAQDYTVTDLADDSPVFRVRGKALSMRMRKELLDAQGNVLFEFHRQLMHMRPVIIATRPGSDRPVFTVRGQIVTVHGNLTVMLWNEANQCEDELFVRADWLDRAGTITLGGRDGPLLCAIKREWFAKLIGSTYHVHVAPGVDTAIMTALCVCLDDVMTGKQ